MSRDFYLVLGGGVVSLVTTLVVLFITDWVYRHDQARASARDAKMQRPASSPEGIERKSA